MSIWSKVLLGFVGLALLGFLHAAARTLKTYNGHRTNVGDHERAIETAGKNVRTATDHGFELAKDDYENVLLRPIEGSPSISQVQVDLHKFMAERGRVWYHVNPQLPIPATGIVTVETSEPEPFRIDASAVLYVFDEQAIADNGKYLGEFRVTAVDGERKLTLAPTEPLSTRHQAGLAAAAGPWVLYEVMPADSHEVFVGLTNEQLEVLIPAPAVDDPDRVVLSKVREALLEQYKKDGKPPEPGDELDHPDNIRAVVRFTKQDDDAKQVLNSLTPAIPEMVLTTNEVYEYDLATAELLTKAGIAEQVGDRVYRRKLWDYVVVLREFSRQEPLLLDRIADLIRDFEQMDLANRDAKVQETVNEAEVTRLKAEGTRLKKETTLAEARRKKLDTQLKQVKADITATLARNKQLAGKLALLQKQAAERAEQALGSEQASSD